MTQSSKTRIPAHPETRDVGRESPGGSPSVEPSGIGSAGSVIDEAASWKRSDGRISKKSLAQLDSFLRGELSAVGTYRAAIARLSESSHTGALREALASHERRAEKLKSHLRTAGGEPSETSGAWGAFAKLYEGGMAMFGEKPAINALESGEDHGVADFKRGLDDLDPVCLEFVQREILPEQERTHRLIADLKHSL